MDTCTGCKAGDIGDTDAGDTDVGVTSDSVDGKEALTEASTLPAVAAE